MPKPKKIIIKKGDIKDEINDKIYDEIEDEDAKIVKKSKNKIDEIIDKMKTVFPNQIELIDKIVENVNIIDKPVINWGIITNKVGEYYLDDFQGVWDCQLNLVGVHNKNKIYLYSTIKSIVKKFSTKK